MGDQEKILSTTTNFLLHFYHIKTLHLFRRINDEIRALRVDRIEPYDQARRSSGGEAIEI